MFILQGRRFVDGERGEGVHLRDGHDQLQGSQRGVRQILQH